MTLENRAKSGQPNLADGLPAAVRMVEVGPRDGLQNEPAPVPVSTRIALVEALASAGIAAIECGSFVSPRWVPQMADTATVFEGLYRVPGVAYSALVPNVQGLEKAAECNVDTVAVFVSASEEFSKANINCSIEESLRRSDEVIKAAGELGIPVRGYVSCVLGCPFEGEIAVADVVRVASALHQIGCYEISLGDTIGVGTPGRARALLDAVANSIPLEKIAVHYHDTWGQALANIFAALEIGIAIIDSSVAGLGGCPYAPGAAGNVATEDVIYMLNGLGVSTGVDLAKVAAAGREICRAIGKRTTSKAALALEAALSR